MAVFLGPKKIQYLQILIRPFIKFCVHRGYTIQDLLTAAKHVFVEIAEEEINKTSERVNTSRISMLTGVHRLDVNRIFRDREALPSEPLSFLGRIVGQWEQDRRFCSKGGKPRTLTYLGDSSEFKDLVWSVSRNVAPGTVLFEMERCNLVEKQGDRLKLIKDLQTLERDPEEGYKLLSSDLETLMHSVEQNIEETSRIANLHIRTEYDNILIDKIPEIRKWLIAEGKAFHKRAREFIAQFDLDITPLGEDNQAGGGRVVVQAFSFTEPADRIEVSDGSEKDA